MFIDDGIFTGLPHSSRGPTAGVFLPSSARRDERTRKRLRRPIVLIGGMLYVWLALGAATVQAQAGPPMPDGVAEAKAHFEKGQRLFRVSRYRDALEEFKEGFVAKADPVFLYNIAQCHRLLGEHAEALTFYRRYLAINPSGRAREDVVRRIHELEAEPEVQAKPAPPPPPAPEKTRIEPLPVTARPVPSSTATEIIMTSPGPAPAETTPVYRRWWLWAGAGAVVAAGVTAAVLLSRPQREAPCGSSVDYCRKL